MPKRKSTSDATARSIETGQADTVPQWLDCSWRRKGCGRSECPICGRLATHEADDAHGRVASWEDVGNLMAEALATIKAEVKRSGLTERDLAAVDAPPPPGSFPLYRRLDDWRQAVFAIADESDDTSSAWLFTEAGEDLLWYADALCAKIYRQLANRWHMEQDDGFGEYDIRYTEAVLAQIVDLLKRSLDALVALGSDHTAKFTLARIYLTSLEEEIGVL